MPLFHLNRRLKVRIALCAVCELILARHTVIHKSSPDELFDFARQAIGAHVAEIRSRSAGGSMFILSCMEHQNETQDYLNM